MSEEETVVNSAEWQMECVRCGHRYKIYGYVAIYDEEQVVCPECGHVQAKVLRMLPAWEVCVQ